MIITMCILWGEQSWLLNFPEEKRVFAGEDKWADIVIPSFGKELQCYQSGKGITVEIREKRRKQKLQTVLDTFLVLDPEERLAVYFTRNQDTAETVPLPADGEVVFGRKRAEPGPGKISVVIGLPFVSGKHFRLLCTNGRISVQDTGSRNGLFLNGRRVRDAELQESDVLSVLTVRMTYRDQALCIENAGGTVEVFAVPEKRGLQAAHLRRGPDKADEYRRSPRLAVALHREEIALEKPPQAGGPPQINWLSVLAMPAISIVLMLVLVLALGMSPIIESMGRKVEIHCQEKVYEQYASLSYIAKNLTDGFIQCHKSFYVNMEYIHHIEPSGLVLDDGTEIPISQTRRKPTREAVSRFWMKDL